MRNARPVALTPDGQRLIVETDDGDRIAILADALRKTLRGDRPRPQVEIQMETGMTPREIQMRIRAGASVEELAEASGMPISRVEAFAAPVIAERDHIAGLAQTGSVRRRGEPAGHRTLRDALASRLRERGVDPETVAWDAFKMDDGRWSVSAGYRLEQSEREAVFYFDQRGRFSVAGNDEARWALGEQVAEPGSDAASQPHAEDVDTEPTLKLAGDAEELALLRAVETDESVTQPEPVPQAASRTPEPVEGAEARLAEPVSPEPVTPEPVHQEPVQQEPVREEPAVPDEQPAEQPAAAEPSQLDLLYDLLGGSDGYSEDSIRVYDGLSDAAAVPEVADSAWEPSADEEFPAEPEAEQAQAEEPQPEQAQPEQAQPEQAQPEQAQPDEPHADEPQPDEPQADGPRAEERPAEQPQVEEPEAAEAPVNEPVVTEPVVTEPVVSEPAVDESAQESAAEQPREEPIRLADGATQDTLPGADTDEPAAEAPKPKARKRKRASVPSWDEIMFGSPKGK